MLDIKNLPISILNNLNIVVTDKNNIIVFVSETYARLLGHTQSEMIGVKPAKFRYPGVNDLLPWDWDKLFWEKLNKDHHWNGILKNIKKDGSPIYINGDIYKDFDDAGNHTGFHAFYTDVTNSITTPHKFIFDNELAKVFFSNDEMTAICLCESDTVKKQKILEISDKFIELIGKDKNYFKRNEVSFTDILSNKSKYYQNLSKLMDDINENNSNVVVEIFDVTENKIKMFKVQIVPFEFDEQKATAKIFRLTDITNEIEYSQKMDDIIKSKNKFLANLSHEIKTPLNAVNGFLTLLQMREDNKEKLDYIDIVLKSTQHLLDLTNDVIDLAGVSNNEVKIIPRDFTARDIQATIEIFFARSLEKNIELTTYISPQLPEVMSQDILRLKQIYTNLISNAIKFVGEGGTVTIDVHHHHNNLHFTIQDTGIGMTDDQIKKVFKPFTQASSDIKLFYGGTGLGLSVVKEIVDLMGGSINITSEVGKGSTFTVIVPIKIIKDKRIEGKLSIQNILIFKPSFSHSNTSIIKKYLSHFTTANIQEIEYFDYPINESCIIINYTDFKNREVILKLSETNKVILIKKLSEVVTEFDEIKSIVEVNFPVLGSKLFDALNTLYGLNHTLFKKSNNLLDYHIVGKILVADDQESNRSLIRELLSKYDVKLDLVEDGKDVIEKFNNSIKDKKSTYDMIFLDMNMHIINGFKAAQTIRDFEKQFGLERTPIIALTANRYDINDSKLVNMDEYIPKPINLKQLLSVIIKYTSNVQITDCVGFDKVKLLKTIRDSFMQGGKNLNKLISEASQYLSSEEFNLLSSIAGIGGDKRKFNKIYNQLLKKVRQNY